MGLEQQASGRRELLGDSLRRSDTFEVDIELDVEVHPAPQHGQAPFWAWALLAAAGEAPLRPVRTRAVPACSSTSVHQA